MHRADLPNSNLITEIVLSLQLPEVSLHLLAPVTAVDDENEFTSLLIEEYSELTCKVCEVQSRHFLYSQTLTNHVPFLAFRKRFKWLRAISKHRVLQESL